ncbi:hypothetical protein BCR32DRAFT_275523 [Anaeromyces robustus]|uniref:Uncharacterized protein n=1 Tax=Anaeromyces robustus TaxID=1754192 RepID=A0A1Y1XKI3_9FUNG|nr:hypothetical protein BCR32DRAFT_275523 [Anaeromyces robustus]|eukprot:ORX86277.1 hypothetical protein BCR32DRAFT_275523 [Anaeromyces robustus]
MARWYRSGRYYVKMVKSKTMSEKAQWLSTGLLNGWYTKYDSTRDRFYEIPTGKISLNNGQSVGESEFDPIAEITGPWEQGNITTAGSFQSYGSVILESFKPTLLIGVYPSTENRNDIKFNVEAEIVCTFRGLRKAKVVVSLSFNENNELIIVGYLYGNYTIHFYNNNSDGRHWVYTNNKYGSGSVTFEIYDT